MTINKIFVGNMLVFLLLAASIAIGSEYNGPAAYRLITSNAEEVAPPRHTQSGTVLLQYNNLYDQKQDNADETLRRESPLGQGVFGENCSPEGCCGNDCGPADCYQPRCCRSRWTATADAIIFDRINGKTTQLMSPETVPPNGLSTNDFDFGFRAGPRLSLIRHGDSCFDVELMYFMVDGWDCFRSIDVGGTFLDPINLDWSSKLYNAELNLRWKPLCRLTVLAGFRWSEVNENFGLATRIVMSDFVVSTQNSARTKNDLYGFQLGTDVKLVEYRCFSIDGLLKAGIFGNSAGRTTTTSFTIDDETVTTTTSVATSRIAFIGEAGLQGCYQVTNRLALRAGYQVMWLDGIASAAAQGVIPSTEIDPDDTLFYHGANAGLEYVF